MLLTDSFWCLRPLISFFVVHKSFALCVVLWLSYFKALGFFWSRIMTKAEHAQSPKSLTHRHHRRAFVLDDNLSSSHWSPMLLFALMGPVQVSSVELEYWISFHFTRLAFLLWYFTTSCEVQRSFCCRFLLLLFSLSLSYFFTLSGPFKVERGSLSLGSEKQTIFWLWHPSSIQLFSTSIFHSLSKSLVRWRLSIWVRWLFLRQKMVEIFHRTRFSSSVSVQSDLH